MTQFPHDEFAKNFLDSLLSPLGAVEVSQQISSEVRYADVYFTPQSDVAKTDELGLLTKLAQSSVVFEPFRNSVKIPQIRACMSKLFDLHQALGKEAKKEKLIMQLSPLYLEKIQAAELVGEERGEARMLMRQLNRRFGDIPTELYDRIGQLNVAQLENLGEALFDFKSFVDLEVWLNQN
jgi:Domain of unknown function (DUF4351)